MIVNAEYHKFEWNLHSMHQRGTIKRMPKNPKSIHTAILHGKPKARRQAYKHLAKLIY